MLTFYKSSNLNTLAGQLSNHIGTNSTTHVLQPDLLLVPNNAISRWVKKYIARTTGIAANIETKFPGEFIWECYYEISPMVLGTMACEKEPMQFSIYELLQSRVEGNDVLQPLHRYINAGGEGDAAKRAWTLSGKIADLFDQYQIYRPEMVLGWQQKKLQTKLDEEKWQAALWRLLQEKWKTARSDMKRHNRAEWHNALIEMINKGTFTGRESQEEIHIFAVSNPAPVFLESFIALSKQIDVHFYWVDVTESPQVDQTYVDAWGKTAQNFATLFDKYTTRHDIEPQTVALDADDTDSHGRRADSVQIHSCHSPMREVEVLHDQLLALFETNSHLNPEDVLITCTDVQKYAPLIDTVFNSSNKYNNEIPYHITDKGGESSVVQTFVKLLELVESRFKVSDLLDLFFSAPVREAFGITEEQAQQLERWIDDNNIRWGIDRYFKEQMDLPTSDHFTWRAGTNRMLLGAAMDSNDDQLFNHIFPYAQVETAEETVLVGRFVYFLNKLFSFYNKTKQERYLNRWADIISRSINTFITDSISYEKQVAVLFQVVDLIKEQATAADFKQKVPFKIIQLWFVQVLEQQTGYSGRAGLGVTFSSMTDMRGIPCKVIGMLGMDDDAFPSRNTSMEFDLMKHDLRPGDPDRLEEDRYLFLESLAAAKEQLYISYVGQSNREDADYPPSVLVSEMLDHLREDKGPMVTNHPLQPFNIRYFNGDGLTSYSDRYQKIAQQVYRKSPQETSWLGAKMAVDDKEDRSVNINDIIAYYQHPAKFVLRDKLGIYIEDYENEEKDRELFKLKGIANHGVKNDLLNRFLNKKSIDDYQEVLRSKDRLPEGWIGQQAFEERAEAVQQFGEEVKKHVDRGQAEDAIIDLEIDNFRLSGKISGICRPYLVNYRFGRGRPKDMIGWWIKHLVLNVSNFSDSDIKSVLLTWKKQQLVEHYFAVPDEPKAILADLLHKYHRGTQKVSYYFPKSTYNYAKKIIDYPTDDQGAVYKAKNSWKKNRYQGPPGESEDAYVKMMVGEKIPVTDNAFKEIAKQVWAPFFKVFNEEKN